MASKNHELGMKNFMRGEEVPVQPTPGGASFAKHPPPHVHDEQSTSPHLTPHDDHGAKKKPYPECGIVHATVRNYTLVLGCSVLHNHGIASLSRP